MARTSLLLFLWLLPSLFGARLVFGTAQAKQKIVVQEQVEEKVYLISVSDDELPEIPGTRFPWLNLEKSSQKDEVEDVVSVPENDPKKR